VFEPALDDAGQLNSLDGLADVVVHPGIEAQLAVPGHRARCHGNYGNMA
jgi:hypothetical protein